LANRPHGRKAVEATRIPRYSSRHWFQPKYLVGAAVWIDASQNAIPNAFEGRTVLRGMVDTSAVEGLIGALERAETSDRALDRAIAFGLGIGTESVNGGATNRFCGSADEPAVPRYTASLDSCIPGENIVLALRPGDGSRWVAVHRLTDGVEVIAWAATECLARRAAALKGWCAAFSADAPLPNALPDHASSADEDDSRRIRPNAPWLIAAPTDDEAADRDWTVRF